MNPLESMRRLRRPLGVVALVAVLVLPPYVLVNVPSVGLMGNTLTFNLLTFCYALAASVAVLSLVLLVGYSGQLSLAAGFFMGLGAYVSILVSAHTGLPFLLAAVVAAIVCGALAALFALPALRIRGTYLALVTITVAAVFPALVRLPAVKGYTGGSNGLLLEGKPEAPDWLPIADAPTVLGHIPGLGPTYIGTFPLSPSQAGSVWLYFTMLASTAIIFWLVAGVLRGRIGRAIIAVRDNEIAAAANGVNVARLKVLVFAISGIVGGLAGGMYAEIYRIVAPESFGLTLAIYLLFGMIVGGHRSMAGAVVGGFAVAYLPNLTGQIEHIPGVADRYLSGPTASLILGLLLVLLPMLMPGGVATALRSRRDRSAQQDAEQHDPDALAQKQQSAARPLRSDVSRRERNKATDYELQEETT